MGAAMSCNWVKNSHVPIYDVNRSMSVQVDVEVKTNCKSIF